nr:MAG TPA: hypothetical protein [Bacteriophage sp.]
MFYRTFLYLKVSLLIKSFRPIRRNPFHVLFFIHCNIVF